MRLWIPSVVQTSALCPYCFMRFRKTAAPFRCTNLNCGSRPEDPVLAKKWPKVALVQRGLTFAPVGRARRVQCSDCKLQTTVRICPECHIRLPREFDRGNNSILAIVGVKEAGKSHFIASAIHELKNRIAAEMECSLEAIEQETMDRYTQQYESPLYDNLQQLVTTGSAMTEHDNRLPMLFSLKLRGKDLFGRNRILRAITLAFFDTAGEDLKAEDTMNAVNRYIAEAGGIILLLDPLQMDHVRAKLAAPAAKVSMAQNQSDLLTRVANLIRDMRGMRQSGVIGIPIAVTLSKFDQLGGLVPDGMIVKEPARHDQRYDGVAAKTIIDEVESLLGRWREAGLLEQVRTNFSRFGFFGVSSTGCSVDARTGRFPFVRPNRVEDPFLWLLHQIGFLRAKGKP